MQQQTHLLHLDEKTQIATDWMIPDHYERGIIIAHGAGLGMESPFISHIQQFFANNNLLAVKFNFTYMQQGRKAPDRLPKLMAAWQAVIDEVVQGSHLSTEQLILSGKSMGGRIASMLAAETSNFAGLIFFGYPLHAPGKQDKPRYEHLQQVQCPMLFIQGTRDNLCNLEVLKKSFAKISICPDLYIIETGDHSFKTLKRMQRNEASVWDEIAASSCDWINRL